MAITMVTVTGTFPNAVNQAPGFAYLLFEPTADLTDITDAEFIDQLSMPQVNLDPNGHFSQPLASNAILVNPQITPQGWLWMCTITIGERSASFNFDLTGKSNPVDITALMPPGWQL
jgi:hypothetical protein